MKKLNRQSWGLYMYMVALVILVLVGATAISGLLSWLLPLPQELPEVLSVIIICDILGGVATALISRRILSPLPD